MGKEEGEKTNWDVAEWKDDFSTNDSSNDAAFSGESNYYEEPTTLFEEDNKEVGSSEILSEEIKSKRQPLPTKPPGPIILSTPVAAATIFIDSAFRGAIIGGVIGGIQGAFGAFPHPGVIETPSLGTRVLAASVTSAKSFGLWLGTYQSVKYYLHHIRHKNDALNPICGGFIASSLAATLTSRNHRHIVFSGLMGGAIMGVMHTLGQSL